MVNNHTQPSNRTRHEPARGPHPRVRRRVLGACVARATGLIALATLAAVVAGCRDDCCGEGDWWGHPAAVLAHDQGGPGVFYVRPNAPPDDGRSRVATFDRSKVLMAYYGSAEYDGVMRSMHQRHRAALSAGRRDEAADLEREGQARQREAHQQWDGGVPLTNLRDSLGAALDQIAQQAGADRVIDAQAVPLGSRPTIDVTSTITAHWPPRQPATGTPAAPAAAHTPTASAPPADAARKP
jgi:hypothetical protein